MSAQPLREKLDELERPIYGPYAYARSLLTGGSHVLDVGFGNGKVSAYLTESGATVDGSNLPKAVRAGPGSGCAICACCPPAPRIRDCCLPTT